MRVAIVEDEKNTQAQLLSYLKRFKEEIGEAIQAEVFDDGIYFAEKYSYDNGFDAVLLDIEMAQLDGMKTAELIREKDEETVIIFITNMAQFVMDGYKVHALDFVLKPVSYYMFCEKIKKAIRKTSLKAEKFIIAKSREQIYKINTKEIFYIEVRNHDLIYHTVSGNYMCSGNLKKVEKAVASFSFSRCSASYIVNLAQIRRVEKDQLIMGNGDIVPIGRTKQNEFMKTLTDYYGGRGHV